MIDQLIDFIRAQYPGEANIPLHAPRFHGREREYVLDCIDSSYVSSVGAYVDRFEAMVREYTGATAAVATVNGTAALHAALLLSGVAAGDLVITQPLTFIATCNAISYCGAEPVFVDVDRQTLGLSATALSLFLEEQAERRETHCVHRATGRILRACVPMHSFGHPADLDGLKNVCESWGIALVEDAAESLGSLYRGVHTGRIGAIGAFSFNGNKIATTGGGGMLIFQDAEMGRRAKHLTTTAKLPHAYEYAHDRIGYNYRLPNLNAALGCAQMERLDGFVAAKRALAAQYASFFAASDFEFVREPADCRSNCWLNAVICPDRSHRDSMLERTNAQGVMTRPVWRLMHHLPMFAHCARGPTLDNAEWLAERLVNLPSSVPARESTL